MNKQEYIKLMKMAQAKEEENKMNKQAYIELIESATSKERLDKIVDSMLFHDMEIGYYSYMKLAPIIARKYSQLRWENEFKEECF